MEGVPMDFCNPPKSPRSMPKTALFLVLSVIIYHGLLFHKILKSKLFKKTRDSYKPFSVCQTKIDENFHSPSCGTFRIKGRKQQYALPFQHENDEDMLVMWCIFFWTISYVQPPFQKQKFSKRNSLLTYLHYFCLTYQKQYKAIHGLPCAGEKKAYKPYWEKHLRNIYAIWWLMQDIPL